MRFGLARADVAAAARWLEEKELGVNDELGYERESDHILLARVLIAQSRTDDAGKLLERLLEDAEPGSRTASVIEVLVLRALVLQDQGHPTQAVDMLGRALPLAQPEGYVRIFLDEGEPMERLIRQVEVSAPTSEYVASLLAALDPTAGTAGVVSQHLPEPLNDRELAILRLMAARLSNHEITDELYLSVNTVKWHARNMYGKLGVAKRTHAVARATELSIL